MEPNAREGTRQWRAVIGTSPEEWPSSPGEFAAGIVAAEHAFGKARREHRRRRHRIWLELFSVAHAPDGHEVRTVHSNGDGIPADAYGEAADGGTRLIAVSAVHSPNGYRTDLAALSQVAARSGAWLFVDACQAAGAVPLDVVRDGVDFLAASSHKFLLGSRGMGYLFVRRALLDRIRPVFPGWKAARTPLQSFYGPTMDLSPTASKLDASLVWFAALAEQAAFGVLRRFGIEAILDRNAQLSRRLHDALVAHRSAFRPFPERHRSTIVSIPADDAEAVMTRLRAASGWLRYAGGIRLSAHFYNLEQIDRGRTDWERVMSSRWQRLRRARGGDHRHTASGSRASHCKLDPRAAF